MKITFQKIPSGLIPLNQNDKEKLKGIKNGDLFEKDFKKIRNPDFHRLVFKFVNVVFHYQNEFDYFDNFRDRLTFLSGYYKEYILIDEPGNYVAKIELGSWSFNDMGEHEFKELFNRIKNICWEKWVTNTDDQQEVERRVNELLRFD